LFQCTFVHCRFLLYTHLLSPLLITAAKIPPVTYYPSKDIDTVCVLLLHRAEKSEVLSEDQQELERRVDLIYRVSQTMLKKLQACLSSQGLPTDAERRMVSNSMFTLTTQTRQDSLVLSVSAV